MISWSSLQAKRCQIIDEPFHKFAPRRTILKISHEHETHTLHLWSSDFRLRKPLRIPTNIREQLYIHSPSTNRKSISSSAEHVALRCGPQIASQLTEKKTMCYPHVPFILTPRLDGDVLGKCPLSLQYCKRALRRLLPF